MEPNTTPEAESKPKPDSKPFPVISTLNVVGFYMSSYLGLSAKIVEPRKVDVDNADKYDEDAVFFHAPEMLKELLRIEPGLKTDTGVNEADWCNDTIRRWNRLDMTKDLIKYLKKSLKNHVLQQHTVEVNDNEAKTDGAEDEDKTEVVLVIKRGHMSLQGTYVHHELILWLVLYVSREQYLKVSKHVHYINSKAIELALQGKEEELEEFKEVVGYDKLKFDELKLENEQLKAKNTELEAQKADLSTKLEIVLPWRSVFIDTADCKYEQFTFIEFRNRTKDCPDFQVVRGQIYYTNAQINLARKKTIIINHGRLDRRNNPPPTIKNEIFITRHDVPNAVNIWNLIKVALVKNSAIRPIKNSDLKFEFVNSKLFGMKNMLAHMDKALNRCKIIP